MSNYKLIRKNKHHFIYSKDNEKYISNICIMYKNTWNKSYKGIQVSCYESTLNSDGFNNSNGLRFPELILLPFWMIHFSIYRLFHRGDVINGLSDLEAEEQG